MFITFEGGEGAGKSTQVGLLAKALEASGQRVLLTREPGGTLNAEELRAMLLDRNRRWPSDAEIYLHFAARVDHLTRRILPALEAGETVLCDRFTDSTMAYQGYGLGADRSLIAALGSRLSRQPDLTILLQTTAAIADERLFARKQALDRYEAMDHAFHDRVRDGFRQIAEGAPKRFIVIGGDGTIGQVQAAIQQALRQHLPGLRTA